MLLLQGKSWSVCKSCTDPTASEIANSDIAQADLLHAFVHTATGLEASCNLPHQQQAEEVCSNVGPCMAVDDEHSSLDPSYPINTP